ncbi:MAG: S9 family peptidase [Pyrinomonadaceae bacterium]
MRSRFSLVLITIALVVSPALAQKRSITERDLFDFVWVADPQISPDGARVAFVRVTVNEKKDGYNTSIWTVSPASGDANQLTAGTRDSSPRWSPDGKFLVFVRVTEKDGRPDLPQLFMLSLAGGDSFQVTRVPRGAGQPQWSPDGKTIAFVNNANAEDLAKDKETQPNPSPGTPPQATASPNPSPATTKGPDDKRESDVRVITRAVYRFNGPGYLDPKRPQHIWLVAAPLTAADKVTPRQLTSGRFPEDSVTWARDSSRLYFTSDQMDEPYFELPKTTIFSIAVAGGQPTKLTSFDMDAGGFSVSPDGKQFAFLASVSQPVKSYSQPDLWVMDITTNAKPRNLTAGLDNDVGAGLTGDNSSPRGGGGGSPVWTADGRSIIVTYAKEGRANLAAFDSSDGRLTDLTRGNNSVSSVRATPDGAKFVYILSTPTRIGDLFWLESGGQPKQLTRFNEALFSRLNLTDPEEIWYQSFDGKRIQAWVQKPPDFDANKKYPLILNIHGGPHAAYGFIFDHEFQWMAAKGYVVLYPNPRGSTTYGQEFGNIIQYNYPGDDHKDLMAGVDELIRRGYIDEKKLGITGGSGGGVLTNWAIGHTQRFAAAVSQRDISDWADWWYTADFTQFQPYWFKGAPFEDPEDFKKRSGITYIDKVTTPLMLILGEADWRTPTGAGGEQMFRALKYRKIPTVMVRFPNESHELSRSGQPWHRIERLQHIVGWFDKWLLGVAKPEYEVGQ